MDSRSKRGMLLFVAGACVCQSSLHAQLHEVASLTTGPGAVSSSIGDFNDDGILDVCVGQTVAEDLIIFRTAANGSFEEQPPIALQGQPIEVRAATVCTHNRGDIVILLDGYQFEVLTQDAGAFTSTLTDIGCACGPAPAPCPRPECSSIAFVVGSFEQSSEAAVVGVGVDDGTVTLASRADSGDGCSGFPGLDSVDAPPQDAVALVRGQFDDDPNLDVAIAGASGTIEIRSALGHEFFAGVDWDANVVTIDVGVGIIDIAAGLVDADTIDDLLVACADNTLRVFTADGVGGFNTGQVVTLASSPVRVLAANTDGDPDADAIVLHDQSVSHYTNDGAASFSFESDTPLGASGIDVDAGNLVGGDGEEIVVTLDNDALVVLTANVDPCVEEQVSNGGFELNEPIGGALPNSFADWTHDVATATTGTIAGIAPLAGDGMLRFESAEISGGASASVACDVVQLVDLSGVADAVATGRAVATFSASFNRVAGDAETDTLFRTNLRAHSGTPDMWTRSQTASHMLDQVAEGMFSDGDPATWETTTIELRLPVGTAYLSAWVVAQENILNDTTGTEFDGHFADSVTITVCDPCEADIDGSPGADVLDLLFYLSNWFAEDPSAELTGDEPADITINDLLAFLSAFFDPACQEP